MKMSLTWVIIIDLHVIMVLSRFLASVPSCLAGWGGTRIWTQGFTLARQVWAIPPALFCVKYFRDRVLRTICLGLDLNQDPPDLCLLGN
jgi:hypothetical protein